MKRAATLALVGALLVYGAVAVLVDEAWKAISRRTVR